MKHLTLLSLFVLAAPVLAAPPNVLNFSGHLAGSAGALTGEVALTVALYDDPDSFAASHLLWSEEATVFVSSGRFHLLLGADPANSLPPAVLDTATLYVGVRVGSDDELRPRLRVASVPFALQADDAGRLGGLSPDAYASAGHQHDFAAVLGRLAPSQLPDEVALDVDLAAGLATKAAVGHDHDATYVNEGQANAVTGAMVQDGTLLLADLGASGCTDGQVAKWSSATGAWGCAADVDTTVSAGTGVVIANRVLSLDQATVVGWATAACYDTPAELYAVLDVRYAATDHRHDDRYPLATDVTAALDTKSDAGHLHDDRYPLATDVAASLDAKSDAGHLHDDRYYTRAQSDAALGSTTSTLQAAIGTKADAGHLHDGRYPLASDTTAALAGKAALVHEHDAAYVNEGQAGAVTTGMLAKGAVTFEKLADGGCADGEVAKWDQAAGRWDCAVDRVLEYTGGDFALSNQACPFGQIVNAIDATGAVVCAPDVVYGPGTGLVLVGSALPLFTQAPESGRP